MSGLAAAARRKDCLKDRDIRHRARSSRSILLIGVLVCFGSVDPTRARPREDAIRPVSASRSPVTVSGEQRNNTDWPKYCANLKMTGTAEGERLISPITVASLRLAWTDSLTGTIASSPTVVAGRVYVGDWSGMEWSIDAPTGVVLAQANLGQTSVPWCSPPLLGITSAPSVSGGVVYLAGGDNAFYALDAANLSVRWRTILGDNSPLGGYYGWCSPAVAADRIFQGVSSNCDDPFVTGRLDTLDPATGDIMSSADLSRTTDHFKEGAGIWTSPAIDIEGGSVFATTGSAYHYDDGLSYSILRFSISDLTVVDQWKLPAQDYALAPDPDWGSSPTLFYDAAGNLLVGAGQKNGYYYAFRRDELADGPVWKTIIAVPGECPQCGEGILSTAAFDGKRLYLGGGVTPGYAARGSVSALDPATGTVVWTTPVDGSVLAPVSFANGVVFAAAGTRCIALDAATGALLWHADVVAPLYGGIAISNGRIFLGDTAGNLYAFEVPLPR